MVATLYRPKSWPRRLVIVLSQPAVDRCSEGSQLILRPAHRFAEGMASVREIRLGQQGGRTKNPPCQSARRVSRKLYQLFSSFLRGASCPKSPRVAATAANPL